jgi:predicted NAD/FAD-binding protein
MEKKSIGIIGGGCSGTVLAWLLSSTYDIKLFEQEAQLGGHVFTYKAQINGQEVPIDMGVDHINEKLCPNIFAVLDKLQIDTFVAPLSMNVSINKCGHSLRWSNASSNGELRENFLHEFDNFHKDMTYISSNFDPKYLKMTVAEFLQSHNYTEEFTHLAIVPLLTSYYGCKAPSLEYSVLYVAVSFDMNLLSFFVPGYWRKIEGGTSAYIEKIFNKIQDFVYLKSTVSKVCKNTHDKLEIILDSGKIFEFDEVVFATSAADVARCIDCSDINYKEILENFGYVPIESVLHTQKEKHAAANEYFSFYSDNKYTHGSLTRINNNLYPYRKIFQPLSVTFDPIEEISNNDILCKKKWELQMLRPMDGLLRSKIRNFQGKNNIWFCGTDTSVTGHEGAVVSAFVLADKLGVPYEFKENKMTLAQFNTVKFIMGI